VVFFMVSSTFILTPGISLVLPQSETSEAVVMTRLVVTVVARDEVYLNKDEYTLTGLDGALEAMSEEEREEVKTVVIEGDREVSYSLMIEVLDVLRRHGYKGVNLRTRETGS
jgi:biopolymer transport protein ExbD